MNSPRKSLAQGASRLAKAAGGAFSGQKKESKKQSTAPQRTQQQRGNGQNANSAKLGNRSGGRTGGTRAPVPLVRGPRDPIVNFGGVVKQFLAASHLGNKAVNLQYVQNEASGEYEIQLLEISFSKLAENGLSYAPAEKHDLQWLLENRQALLGSSKAPTDKWLEFTEKLLIRTGLTITEVPSQTIVKDVIRTVRDYLTPIETGVMALSESEWNDVDTVKLRSANLKQIAAQGSGFSGRVKYINDAIAGKAPVKLVIHEWHSLGLSYPSKADMKAFNRQTHLTSEQETAIGEMRQKFAQERGADLSASSATQ